MFRRSSVLGPLIALLVVGVGFVQQADAKSYRVHGKQVVVDENAGTYTMHGGLIGDWAVTSFEEDAGGVLFRAHGTETFSGCLNRGHDRSCKGDPKGTLEFTFEYAALFGSADPSSLVWGACLHPIVSGTGAFAGSRGVLTMVDHPSAQGVTTRYIGSITLAGDRKGHGARAGAAATAATLPRCGGS
jgi:hypothetical protein